MLHWRAGLFFCVFLLWIAVTGMLLNHARSLGFQNVHIEMPLILAAYNMNVPDDYVEKIDILQDSTVVHTQDGKLELSPSDDVQQHVAHFYRGDGITLEKLVLDLHTGKVFGLAGTVFSDLTALAIIFLTLSGLYILWKRRHP